MIRLTDELRHKCRMNRLTDEQWERIRSHFPEEHIADGRPGRKPIPTRRVLEAALWLLNTGAQWHMLPRSCHSACNFESGDRRAFPFHRSALTPLKQQIGILSLLGRHPKLAHPDRLLVCLAEKAVIGFKIFAYSNIRYATEKMG